MNNYLDKFREWYMTNANEITWFLIGFLIAGGIESLSKGHYVDAALSFGIAFANYMFCRK